MNTYDININGILASSSFTDLSPSYLLASAVTSIIS